MKNIRKHKRQISYLFLLSILIILYIIATSKYSDVNNRYSYVLNISLLVLILLLYWKVRYIFSTIKKEHEKLTGSLLPENVTIEQVINPKQEETQAHITYNQNSFNSLIEQFNKIDNPNEIAKMFLSRMAKEFEIVQGLFYKYNSSTELFEPIADYAFYGEEQPQSFKISEGLNGQVARDKKTLYISELPNKYRQVVSGLGKREPKYIIIIPIISNDNTVAVVELALFNHLDTNQITILEKILNNLCGHFEK